MISEKMALGDSSTFVQQDLLDTMKISAQNGKGGGAADMMGMMMGMNMMNQNNMMGNNMNQQQNKNNIPPPPPTISYYVAVNGQQSGPFDMTALTQFAAQGQFTQQSMVWKQGMAAWTAAGQVPELAGVFSSVPPPLPPPIA